MITLTYLLALGLSAPAASPDQHPNDHRRAFEARRDGRLLPVREIERRVVPAMAPAQYIGFDFDSGAEVYTLKFLRDGRVIWVDIDGHTGQVLGRTR